MDGVVGIRFGVTIGGFKEYVRGRAGLLTEDGSPYYFYLSSHGVLSSIPTNVLRVT